MAVNKRRPPGNPAQAAKPRPGGPAHAPSSAKPRPARKSNTAYGRGSGIPHPVDVEVGARIRQRRLLLGINQETLADRLDLTFQQVQKYEGGANRVSASRLSEIATALDTTISYFFHGIGDTLPTAEEQRWRDFMRQTETIDLVRFYYSIPDEHVRKQFLDLVKAACRPKGNAP
jgi:transcriptional regulator with XRE-family HTH domain